MRWPEDFAYHEQDYSPNSLPLPFVVRAEMSRLRLVIDADARLSARHRSYFELLATREGSGVDLLDVSLPGDAPAGTDSWRLREVDGTYSLELVTEESRSLRRVRPHLNTFVDRLATERGLPRDAAFRAHARYEAAFALDTDLFVSDREPLFGWRRDGRMFSCRPQEAMAVLGLYQRLHGPVHLLGRIPIRCRAYETAMEASYALLPEMHGLFDRAGVASAEWAKATSMLVSARTRVERVLHDRDHLIARSMVAGRNLPFSTAEALVERIALNLSGLFDALARAINLAMGLGVADHRCSFKRKDFRRTLPGRGLQEAAGDAQLQALLEVLALLRNTIHHEALGAGMSTDRRADRFLEPLAVLPLAESEKFRGECQRLGRTSRWLLDLPGSVDGDLGAMARALPMAEDLLELAISHCRRILQVADWPGHASPSSTPGFLWADEPAVVEQVMELYGLSG